MVELTAWQVAWEPQLHARFPAAFRAAARTLLLAQRREDDGRAAAAAAADGSRRRQRGVARQCGSSAAHSHGNNPLALLSADLVLRIIGHAAHPLSAWL